ncbi:hypothetical protein NKR23_g2124 [Pleurostoma richardsiae]|uniref:Uncharacterized protein n=1 Tax=Pleurostoma richardsiae TaxID=41990 RepID=A0AA38RY45_9PEZI|nr:hypothetical protein NKR23_g2124 [Pleurostoma richardsiae]
MHVILGQYCDAGHVAAILLSPVGYRMTTALHQPSFFDSSSFQGCLDSFVPAGDRGCRYEDAGWMCKLRIPLAASAV